MNDAIMVLSGVAGFALLMIYLIAPIELDCSHNPFTWRSERRSRLEKARVRRISILEHDLGYVPCSNDDCYTCARTIFLEDGRKHVMKSSTPPSMKSIKKAKKNRRAPARKAV